MARKLISSSIDELELLSKQNAANIPLLKDIHAEVKLRSSARARRLYIYLDTRIGQAATMEPPEGKARPNPIQISPKPKPEGVDSGRAASALLSEQATLKEKVGLLEKQVLALNSELDRANQHRDRLRNQLAVYLNQLIPGFSRAGARDNTDDSVLARARRAELQRLEKLAYEKWPSRGELEMQSKLVDRVGLSLEKTKAELSSARIRLADLSEFLRCNATAISIELENDLVKKVAQCLIAGEDEFSLLAFITQMGHADAIDLLARARIYSTNVLKKIQS